MTDVSGRIAQALQGRYEIERDLGEGGMAIVYLARDIRHNRQVALKVLRPELAAVIGAERFLKEIEVTAGLQHPHILPLHDSGDADGFLFYVMPYVEGETLRDQLRREKQLGIDEAVAIARSIGTALDYAHRKGVIHRDIKPENILMNDGQALVADFGIALAVSHASGTRLTETGLSVGTPHYMSPEQAMGDRELDARSDVYSLGAVLYEMLAGDPPYTGSTAQAIVAKVITEKAPSISQARDTVPPHVAAAVQKALAKLPADRFHSAAEFAAALANPAFTTPQMMTAAGGDSERSRRSSRRQLVVGAALSLLAVAALWGWMRPAPETAVARYALDLPPDQAIDDGLLPSIALAPDASWFVYVGPGSPRGQLWVKARDRLDAVPVPGTEGATAPAVSPDGQWIAFVAGGALRKIQVGGGSATTLADSLDPEYSTAAWLDDGSLVFADFAFSLRLVAASGGRAEIIRSPATDRFLVAPSALPDGHGVLFLSCDVDCQGVSELWAMPNGGGEARMLLPDIAQAWYAEGQLVYLRRDGAVFAQPFDVRRLELSGAGVPLFDGVRVIGVHADLAVSPSGSLMYIGGPAGGAQGVREAVWVARDGRQTPVDSTWRFSLGQNPGWSLSPDGRRVAIGLRSAAGQHIWVKELDRGPLSRLTFGAGEDQRPHWSADGRSVLYTSTDGVERRALFRRRADGTGEAAQVLALDRAILEAVQSPDGAWILLRLSGTSGQLNQRDVAAIRPGKDSLPLPLLSQPYDERAIALSPNGRWLAYESNETGRNEIFVRPFPDVGAGKWQASTAGGRMPLWARSGRELFFMNGQGELVALAVTAQSTFERGAERVLFLMDGRFETSAHYTPFDISPDDQRFLMVRPVSEGTDGTPGRLIVVEHWLEELRRIVSR